MKWFSCQTNAVTFLMNTERSLIEWKRFMSPMRAPPFFFFLLDTLLQQGKRKMNAVRSNRIWNNLSRWNWQSTLPFGWMFYCFVWRPEPPSIRFLCLSLPQLWILFWICYLDLFSSWPHGSYLVGTVDSIFLEAHQGLSLWQCSYLLWLCSLVTWKNCMLYLNCFSNTSS